jgi:hypothetical protein
VLTVLAVACRSHPEQSTLALTLSTPDTPAALTSVRVAAELPSTNPGSPLAVAQKPENEGTGSALALPSLSQDELVALLAAAAPVLTETPDAAAKRFQAVGTFEQLTPLPERLELEAQRQDYVVSIEYVKDVPGWVFENVQVKLYASEGRSLKTVYDAADRTLRARLHKPVWSQRSPGSALRAKGYRVGKTMELRIMEGADKAHGGCISLDLGEPQGEDE